MKLSFPFLVILWILILILLFIFSFTQIDLNLTFLNWQPYLSIQDQLIQLGYFHRDLNGWFYIVNIFLLSAFYIVIILLTYKEKITFKQLKVLIFLSAGILFFSYNGLSHDFFNYIFDARILTVYHQNPYLYKALDFPQDEMIRFMHWVHRTYPYGPGWLLITVIPSFLGFGKFILTFYLFKMIFVLGYILSAKCIYEIIKKLYSNKEATVALALFAFNPLVIVEGLVSPHLDFVMMAFALAGLHFFLRDRKISYLMILLSAGIKFSTILFIPFLLTQVYEKLGKKKWLILLFITTLLGMVGQVYYSHGFQSWYMLGPAMILPLIYPVLKLRWTLVLALVTVLPLLNYIGFIFNGHW